MDKQELVRIFNEIGLLLELKGENPFKSRAYYNAARLLDNLDTDLEQLFQEGKISELPGFGEALVKKVVEWRETGTIEYYEDLKTSTPPGLLELLKVPGLGAKKINVLYTNLGLTSLEQLEEACQQNRLVALPGFGVKTQAKILAGIEFIKDHRDQYLLAEVIDEARHLLQQLHQNALVTRAELAGSLRRLKEVVKDIDLVAASTKPEAVIQFFISLPAVATVIASGSTKASVTLRSGVNVDLRVVRPEEYSHALQHF
ncbi:MAG TPA: helix-hairpin-helix domain-containing protein, partial [Bacillota bacterium]|nr:helix-hairpin-helix domain-containing protein [Bacillota bacterium]